MKQSLYCTKRRRQAGFTLVELMITVTVAAILAALAAPSFKSLMARQRVKTASADLVAHLTLSRSEAIKQNGDVSMVSASGDNSWANGWSITGAGGTVSTHAALIGLTISTGAGGVSSIVFNRSGRSSASGAFAAFQINDAADSTVVGRCVTIGPTGQTTSKDGSC